MDRRFRDHLQLVEGAIRLARYDTGVHPRVWGKPLIEIDDLVIGDRFRLHSKLRKSRIAGRGQVRIGNDVGINHGVVITAQQSVIIGNEVGIAEDCFIMDAAGHGLEGRPIEAKPVVIGDGVWIGFRTVILPGVRVGSRAVIGACSVVTKDVPADTVVAGNPARVIRTLSYPADISRAWHSSTDQPQDQLVEAPSMEPPDLSPRGELRA